MKQRINFKRYGALALAIILGTGQPWALLAGDLEPSTNRLTLEGAIRLALENNPNLRAAKSRVTAAGGRASQAKLWSNPELTLSAEDWPLDGGGFSDSKKLIGVAQTVPFPGKKRLDQKIGVSGVHISEAEAAQRRIEVVRDTKISFFQVLAAQRLVEVQEDLVRVAESSAETARKRADAGEAADQERLRAEIPFEHAKSDLARFRRELQAALQNLITLLGRPDLANVQISGELAIINAPQLLSREPSEWLSTHPSVVIARRNRERAELELRRARLEPYPDVRVGVAGGQESGRGGSIVQVGLSVPLPIIDSSKGKKLEARANVDVADAELTTIEQQLSRDWNTARERLRTAAQQVNDYRERILPKANEALRLVQTGFEQGKFGFIDLLDTQRTTAEARLGYQQRLLELNIAQAEIEALAEGDPELKPASAAHHKAQP